MKILVSGNAGAGKSSLGRKLAEKYSLPLYGLDKIVWKEEWKRTPREERDEEIKKILEDESWVLEGITKAGLKEANMIYFLDIHPLRCALNVLFRFIKNGLGPRPELPNKCPEYIGFFKALKIICIFPRVSKPWLVDKTFRKEDSKFIHVKSYRELRQLGL